MIGLPPESGRWDALEGAVGGIGSGVLIESRDRSLIEVNVLMRRRAETVEEGRGENAASWAGRSASDFERWEGKGERGSNSCDVGPRCSWWLSGLTDWPKLVG